MSQQSPKSVEAEPNEPRVEDRVQTVMPVEESPAARCPHCDQPLATERLCALHVGERHRDAWTEAERERFESAVDDEDDELFVFHLKVIGALVLTFFAFSYVYVFVWS